MKSEYQCIKLSSTVKNAANQKQWTIWSYLSVFFSLLVSYFVASSPVRKCTKSYSSYHGVGVGVGFGVGVGVGVG